jgi:hypothetical protein
VKGVASSDQGLTIEERNFLSVAHNNVIVARCASWRIVSSIEQKQAECYGEIVENVKGVASSDQGLTIEERNFLSVVRNNVIVARCASWRIVSSIEQNKAECNGEMVENVKRGTSSDRELTIEVCGFFSVAHNNVIGARCASWRIVSSIEQKLTGQTECYREMVGNVKRVASFE